ncbi:MAG TPA: VWA domain-containing protein [Acidimicrobiales bacterium]|nr:VWA domain-containing protein [Acidimicrobiales bacterium]
MSLEESLVRFCDELRAAGVGADLGSVTTFCQAVAAVGTGTRDAVYWAGRATLVRHPADIGTYDATFTRFWSLPHSDSRGNSPVASRTIASRMVEMEGEEGVGGRFSAAEVLRAKDMAGLSDGERDEVGRLIDRLRPVAATRRSRRATAGTRRSGRLAARAVVRDAGRTGGEPVRLSWLQEGRRPRRLVLLCDVSGSMEPYARALLRFLHSAVRARPGTVEAFALGTRLTRLTRLLSTRDADAAIINAGTAVADWAGGTRLGEGLRAFNDGWGVRGVARGAVVVILSDGWDRGDPALVAEQMARLSRVAHRVVWVNPLRAAPGYEPLAQGMAAALPFVDRFVDGHSLGALEDLVGVVAG